MTTLSNKEFVRPKLPIAFKPFYTSECGKCLAGEGGQPIRPRGNWESLTAIVGEAPGRVEEEVDCFFTGPAGRKLMEGLSGIGLSPDQDFFFVNALQCRPKPPPGIKKENRTPLKDEVVACRPHLSRLLHLQNPKLIVAVGATGVSALFKDTRSPLKERIGRFFPPSSLVEELEIEAPVYVTWHPSFVLRDPKVQGEWTLQLIKLRDYMVSSGLVVKSPTGVSL